ncbi:MAG: class I SAM-dependent methyltransferase, partial [Pseudomonadota bacterium]
QRRLEHLATLGLDVRNRSVLDVGAGIGSLASFFINRDCQVTAIEPRRAARSVLNERYPTVTVLEHDFETVEHGPPPRREIVLAYSVLDHMKDPTAALERMVAATKAMLLIETRVSLAADDSISVFEESAAVPALGIHGYGCNPSRLWIFNRLKRLLPHVYVPATQPNHPDFPTNWASPILRPNAARAVFIAARRPIENAQLLDYVPDRQERAP